MTPQELILILKTALGNAKELENKISTFAYEERQHPCMPDLEFDEVVALLARLRFECSRLWHQCTELADHQLPHKLGERNAKQFRTEHAELYVAASKTAKAVTELKKAGLSPELVAKLIEKLGGK